MGRCWGREEESGCGGRGFIGGIEFFWLAFTAELRITIAAFLSAYCGLSGTI